MASELTREDAPAPLRALLEFVKPADE